jgi:hypothetical protein
LDRLCSNPHRPPLALIEIECSGLPDEVAELSETVCPRIEVGGNVGEMMPHDAQADPAILRLHLRDRFGQDRDGSAGWLQSLRGRLVFGGGGLCLGQEIFRVDESAARLSEALRGFLDAKFADFGATNLFPYDRDGAMTAPLIL